MLITNYKFWLSINNNNIDYDISRLYVTNSRIE